MDEELLEKAEAYAIARGLKVARGLGFGISFLSSVLLLLGGLAGAVVALTQKF